MTATEHTATQGGSAPAEPVIWSPGAILAEDEKYLHVYVELTREQYERAEEAEECVYRVAEDRTLQVRLDNMPMIACPPLTKADVERIERAPKIYILPCDDDGYVANAFLFERTQKPNDN